MLYILHAVWRLTEVKLMHLAMLPLRGNGPVTTASTLQRGKQYIADIALQFMCFNQLISLDLKRGCERRTEPSSSISKL